MAIHQHPRENLLLEATAYTRRCLYAVPRGELCRGLWTGPPETPVQSANYPPVQGTCVQKNPDQQALLWEWLEPFQQRDEWELFIGLRADERWAIYFDEQPVMQFNRQSQLRRLFAGDHRYAANQGRLHRLDRSSLGGQVQFRQLELDDASQRAVLVACQHFLAKAAQALQPGRARRKGEFPAGETNWLPAFEQNLQFVASGLTIAASPAH